MNRYAISLLALAVPGQACAQATAGQTGTTPATDQTGTGSPSTTAPAGDDVVVTATRSGDAIPVALIGSSVTVLSNQDLQDRQTRVLSDALRDVPGVAVNRSGAVGDLTEVRIRGSESNQVLVFIDGIKADDPYQGEFDFSSLLNDEASRVEVLRGQQSSLYGSDAIGGVITYTTLSGRELPGVSLRGEGGSMGTYDGGARVAGVLGDSLDYALTSSYYHTDGYPIAPGGSRDIGADLLGASGKLNWTPTDTLKLTAVGRYSYTRAETDDQTIVPQSPVVQGYPVIDTVDSPGTYSTNRGLYGLVGATWNVFGDTMTNAAQLTIADTTRRGFDPGPYGSGESGDHGRRWRASGSSTVRFGNDQVKNRFTLAVDWEREDFHDATPGGYADNSTHRIDQLGVVAQYDVTVADRLAVSASARIDSNSRFEDDATYRATASYLFPSGTRLHAAYGTGVKDPTATQLYDYSSGQYVGNPNLLPERSEGWEAGVEQRLLGGHATLGATYFDSRFTHQIDTTYTQVGNTYLQTPYNEAGHSRQRGVEAYASATLDAFRAALSYTYLDAPQVIDALAGPAPADGSFQPSVPLTIQAARRPRNIGSANLTWAPKTVPVTATVTVRYNGRQNDYAFNEDFSRLVVPLKAYTLVNLDATYDLTRHVQLFGRVENLADDRYQEVFTYQAPGRAGYGGVKVRF